jgi:serine/threonine protein kinase
MVFVAVDTELSREVALKQILDSHAADETSRRRFLLEAEITGGLEHPGVVPVYGLGSYADGRPHYAMGFIGGDELKDVIERFHQSDISTAIRAGGKRGRFWSARTLSPAGFSTTRLRSIADSSCRFGRPAVHGKSSPCPR